MLGKGLKILEKKQETRPIWRKLENLPKNGTVAQKVENGTQVMVSEIGKIYPREGLSASNAERSSRINAATRYFVQTLANQLGGEHQGKTTKLERALSAVLGFVQVVTASKRIVRAPAGTVHEAGQCNRVYDLTVEGQHEFFADGVLVHNCIDALRYAAEGVRRAPEARTFTMPATQSHWSRYRA